MNSLRVTGPFMPTSCQDPNRISSALANPRAIWTDILKLVRVGPAPSEEHVFGIAELKPAQTSSKRQYDRKMVNPIVEQARAAWKKKCGHCRTMTVRDDPVSFEHSG
jgi:hypothetical protein